MSVRVFIDKDKKSKEERISDMMVRLEDEHPSVVSICRPDTKCLVMLVPIYISSNETEHDYTPYYCWLTLMINGRRDEFLHKENRTLRDVATVIIEGEWHLCDVDITTTRIEEKP